MIVEWKVGYVERQKTERVGLEVAASHVLIGQKGSKLC